MRTACPGHESRLEPKPEWKPRYRGADRLKGKVAIITGADSGIGRAVAALYAREGADIAIVYLLEDDDAAETRRIVEAEGRRATTIQADVGSGASPEWRHHRQWLTRRHREGTGQARRLWPRHV